MIEGDQHFHIIEFHPQINYLPGTNNGRAVCAWISSYKKLKPTWNPVERHYFARTLHHLYSRYRCHRCLPHYSCNFVDVTSELVWRPRLLRNIICSWFEGGINYGRVEDSSLHHVEQSLVGSIRAWTVWLAVVILRLCKPAQLAIFVYTFHSRARPLS